ncbi:MAG: inositol monophosphatase [Candidatus Omnitrophica bacterium]|nr:inositol monophosphatase [Candidatus Omnitrophota bacterium]
MEAALKAGAYIKRNVGKHLSVRYKGEINVVTHVDKNAERIIVERIKKSFPCHAILAEEKNYAKVQSDFKWIIDPLDGTTNFLHGFPFFCVSVALFHKEKPLFGVVYDPEKNELFTGECGKGAYLNRKRIGVSKIRELKKSMLVTGFAYNVKSARNNNIENFTRFLKASQAVRRAGSAALDLCYVACGRFDGFWELYLNPWDMAAGALILEEAGGKITQFDGSPFTVYDKELLASNSKLHSQMIRVLQR